MNWTVSLAAILFIVAGWAFSREVKARPLGADMFYTDQAIQKATRIIKRFETEKQSGRPTLKIYKDESGFWHIGYGHKIIPGDPYHPYGAIKTISESEALDLLRRDMDQAIRCVRQKVNVELTTNQFAALISFVYNVGCSAFTASTMLKKINAGRVDAAAVEFPKWTRAGGAQSAGLYIRRKAEQEVYLS